MTARGDPLNLGEPLLFYKFIGDDMRHEYVIGAMVGVLGINLVLGVTCVILICMGYTEIHLNII